MKHNNGKAENRMRKLLELRLKRKAEMKSHMNMNIKSKIFKRTEIEEDDKPHEPIVRDMGMVRDKPEKAYDELPPCTSTISNTETTRRKFRGSLREEEDVLFRPLYVINKPEKVKLNKSKNIEYKKRPFTSFVIQKFREFDMNSALEFLRGKIFHQDADEADWPQDEMSREFGHRHNNDDIPYSSFMRDPDLVTCKIASQTPRHSMKLQLSISTLKFHEHPCANSYEKVFSEFAQLLEKYFSLHGFSRLKQIFEHIEAAASLDSLRLEHVERLNDLLITFLSTWEDNHSLLNNLLYSYESMMSQVQPCNDEFDLSMDERFEVISCTKLALGLSRATHLLENSFLTTENVDSERSLLNITTQVIQKVKSFLTKINEEPNFLFIFNKADEAKMKSILGIGSRRSTVKDKRERYGAQVLINGKVVCRSQIVCLERPSLILRFNQQYNCLLARKIETMKIRIFRVCSFGRRKTRAVLDIPTLGIKRFHLKEFHATNHNPSWFRYQFASSKAVKYKSNDKHICCHLRGYLLVSVDIQKFQNKVCDQRWTIGSINLKCTAFSNGPFTENDCEFRIPGTNITYTNSEAVFEPFRQRLLRMRNNDEGGAIGQKKIPLQEQLCREQYEDVEINSRSLLSQKNKKRVHRSRSVQSYVHEKELFQSTNHFQLSILKPKRSLYASPHYKMRTREDSSMRQHRLSIKVVSAIGSNLVNVFSPNRLSINANTSSRSKLEEKLSGTIVQITVDGTTKQTRPVHGPSPSWNQTLYFPLSFNEGDISSVRFEKLLGVVNINLFKERTIDLKQYGGFYDDEATIVKEKAYLGSTQLPFEAVYSQQQIDGLVLMNNSSTIFETDNNGNSSDHQQSSTLTDASSKIRLIARVEPMSKLPTIKTKYPSKEDEILQKYSTYWTRVINKRTGQNKASFAMITHTDGYSYFQMRFLNPMRPPVEKPTIPQCLHFVSLIPSNLGSNPSLEEEGQWQTNNELVRRKVGSTADIALLLFNYLSYLNETEELPSKYEIYLVIGVSIEEGETVHVLTIERASEEAIFYIPTTGKSYTQSKSYCPLLQIFSLVSMENIYANIKRKNSMTSLSFDITDKSTWRPFYSTNFKPPVECLPSLQVDVQYEDPDLMLGTEIQNKLSSEVRYIIRASRRFQTSFLQDVEVRLQSILQRLEISKLNGVVESPSNLVKSLCNNTADGSLKRGYFYGVPMHFRYCIKSEDKVSGFVQDIVSQIKMTQVHKTKHPAALFAVAVYVVPYPGNFMSVWVCVLMFEPER